MIFILNTFVFSNSQKRKVGELINEKRFLALAIVLGTGLLSGCTNAGEKTAVSYKGGTISEQEVMDSLKKCKEQIPLCNS